MYVQVGRTNSGLLYGRDRVSEALISIYLLLAESSIHYATASSGTVE